MLPTIQGLIDRRVLLNYRADPDEIAPVLPAGMRPRVVKGYALIGVCLIRFRELRPRGVPRWAGMGSENAAHRISVVCDEGDAERTGVYVLRRDSDHPFVVHAGGRVFPGLHSRASFRCRETDAAIAIRIRGRGRELVRLAGTVGGALGGAVFADHAAASAYFREDRVGYSPGAAPGRIEGLELDCATWETEPLRIREARVELFDRRFASHRFDHALLMRGIAHRWHEVPRFRCA